MINYLIFFLYKYSKYVVGGTANPCISINNFSLRKGGNSLAQSCDFANLNRHKKYSSFNYQENGFDFYERPMRTENKLRFKPMMIIKIINPITPIGIDTV